MRKINAIAYYGIAASVVSFSMEVYADCINSTDNNIFYVVCSGVTTAQENIYQPVAESINANILDVWNYSGANPGRLGLFNIQDFAGNVDVFFDAKLTWDDYVSHNSRGAAGVINIAATGLNNVNRPENIKYISSTDSLIDVEINDDSYSLFKNALTSIFAQDSRATNNQDGIYIENNGVISINVNLTASVGVENFGMYAIANETDVKIINNGTINLDSINTFGTDFYGVFINGTDVNSSSETIDLVNNGTIDINNIDASRRNWGVYILAQEEYRAINVINNGAIKINGAGNGSSYAIYAASSVNQNSFEIINANNATLYMASSVDYAIFATELAIINVNNYGVIHGSIRGSDSNLISLGDTINNYGSIVGDVNLYGGDDVINVRAGRIVGNIDMGDGNDALKIFNGRIDGSLLMGGGDDNVFLYSGDYSGIKLIDAGNGGSDIFNLYSNINAGSGSLQKGTEITRFNTINIESSGLLNLTGSTLVADQINIKSGGAITFDYTINQASFNGNLGGVLFNAGLIDLHANSGSAWRVISALGNYEGANGSINVGTMWNESLSRNGMSYVDNFHVDGNVSGKTLVIARNGIVGSIKPKDYDRFSEYVISVDGAVDASAFWGYANTMNAGEAQLVFDPSVKKFSWLLSAADDNEIYSPDVPGYVLTPYVNMEILRDSISTYRDRIGSGYNKIYALGNASNGHIWGRTWHKHMKGEGVKRLDWKSISSGYQFGVELEDKTVENGSVRTDAYASYIRASSNAYDRFSSESGAVIENKYAGNMHTHNVNIGLTRTYVDHDNGYKDIVIQFSNIKNNYNGRRGGKASNKAWAATASFEQGKEFNFSDQWYIEPMYQVMANYLSLNDFNDGWRDISQGKHWDGLLRVGGRLYFRDPINETQNNLLYMKTHYVRDFSNNGKSNIGASYVTEENSKQWMEFGLGFQVNGSKNTHFFMDASMDRNLGGAYRNTYQVQFGISHKW